MQSRCSRGWAKKEKVLVGQQAAAVATTDELRGDTDERHNIAVRADILKQEVDGVG